MCRAGAIENPLFHIERVSGNHKNPLARRREEVQTHTDLGYPRLKISYRNSTARIWAVTALEIVNFEPSPPLKVSRDSLEEDPPGHEDHLVPIPSTCSGSKRKLTTPWSVSQ
jgi:hypothetical protein